MNRLQAELQRLFGIRADAPGAAGADAQPPLTQAVTRLMVLEVSAPPGWDALGPVWQAVQADLELSAPGIAVSGLGSYQLWFGLEEPVAQVEALSFLQRLRARYLASVAAERLAMHTSASPTAASTSAAGCVAPPLQRAPDRWSAFLSPDLAALFADEPWLDMPPGVEAQGELLARLQTTRLPDLRRASARLAPDAAALAPAGEAGQAVADANRGQHPQQFLLEVMNDRSVELGLRIEAAKALLPYSGQGLPCA